MLDGGTTAEKIFATSRVRVKVFVLLTIAVDWESTGVLKAGETV
jgi:hypothetical protein